MTMPHLMNCSHSEEGWCLDCVKEMWLEYNPPEHIMHCMFCKKEMEEVSGRINRQPEGGGEVQIRFDFGSRHDMCLGMPGREYVEKESSRKKRLLSSDLIVAYICDECFEERLEIFEGWRIADRKQERIV